VYEVLRQHIRCGTIEIVRLIQIQVLSEDLQQIRAALGDVVSQKFDPIDAHQREYCVVLPLEVGFTVLEFHGGEFAAQNLYKKIAAPARRLQKAGVNTQRLILHQVKHSLDHPIGGEHLPMVGDALL